MYAMFNVCSSLESINLSTLNTTKVKDMCYLFALCESLKSLDLSTFNTTNVNKIWDMFYGCSSLKKENVKISKNGGKIMEAIKKYLK